MTPNEDPASVMIPTATVKDTSEHEFIASATNISMNASSLNATADSGANQSQDGQKDTARHSMSNDTDSFERMQSTISIVF